MKTDPVRASWRLSLACAFLCTLVLTGCGGLHVSKSFSPLDFLLPGAGSLLHVQDENLLPFTNAIIAYSALNTEH